MSIMNSVNTNIGAQIALQNLNSSNKMLQQVQNRISTGMRVASAQDDGASFAIAQGLRSDVKAVGAVNEQLNKAKGLLSVTLAGLTQVSEKLGDVRAVLTKLADENVTGDTRSQYEADYNSLLAEITSSVSGSSYNGTNMLETASTDVNVISDILGSQITIGAVDLEAEVAGVNTAPATAAASQDLIDGTDTGFDDLVSMVNDALNDFAATDRRITGQIEFNSKLSDALEVGLGATVDADLAKESARLQSLQIKQQLGTQALGIANQAPQILLGLFR